ncbi:hypothetical protein D3C73_795480 [compost metagenome]
MKQYNPLSFADIVQILQDYPDVYIITDTKETDAKVVKEQFTYIRDQVNQVDPELIDRIIPEIYSPEMMGIVDKIIPFKHQIFSIYLSSMTPYEVVQYVKNNNLSVVAMPVERATPDFIRNLRNAGAVTYIHSLNTVDEAEQYKNMGVHGFYTDFLTYEDLNIDTSSWTAAAFKAEPAIRVQDFYMASIIAQATGIPITETLTQLK